MADEPRFLSLDLILKLHRMSLATYGGSDGIRDQSGLESAIDAPRNIFFYENGDLFEIAAGYAFHIAEAQAFVDGNKRTGIAAALVFLDLHGCNVFGEDPMTFYDDMIRIANHESTRKDFATRMREKFRNPAP